MLANYMQKCSYLYLQNLHQYVDMKYLRPWFMRERADQQAIDETVLMVYRKISSRYENISTY
jgi:hypothetical protein